MWERRYGIVNPQRNIGNIRHYSLQDVQRLLDIAFLSLHGYRISNFANLDKDKIEQKLSAEELWDKQHTRKINKLIVGMFSGNIEDFENVLDYCIETLDVHQTIEHIIIPFLEKVNILSYKDSGYEVHFAVTAVRKKLILGIEKIPSAGNIDKTALMFLPTGEHYDLMLLYMTYVLKGMGYRTLYLGTNISEENLKVASENKKPNCLCTYHIPGKPFRHQEIAGYLRNKLPASKLFIATGSNHLPITIKDSNVNYFHYKQVQETIENLSNISAQ